jgi:hypothetical protein
MTPRTLKIVALCYLVKTLLIGVAWLAIPDLPARASAKAREMWSAMFETSAR